MTAADFYWEPFAIVAYFAISISILVGAVRSGEYRSDDPITALMAILLGPPIMVAAILCLVVRLAWFKARNVRASL